MGIYIFDTDVLLKALEADAAKPSSHDFGKDIIPTLINELPTYAYRFYDENKKASKCTGATSARSTRSTTNMDLCGVDPSSTCMIRNGRCAPTSRRRRRRSSCSPREPAAGEALDSIISPGCIISGSQVVGSVLCPNVRVHSYGVIEQSMLMPGVRVGRHARIRRAIIDRDVLIPRGAVVYFNPAEDRKRHTVTDLRLSSSPKTTIRLFEPISEEALRIEAEDDGR